MSVLYAVLLLVAGSVFLYYGAEYLVRGAVMLSQKAGISPLVIGLTVVAFGTSMPEMVVSASAACRGNPDIALGNIIGSNICNVGLILGLSALIRPLNNDKSLIKFDIPFLCFISLLLAGIWYMTGIINWITGCVFFAGLLFFIIRSVKVGKQNDETEVPDEAKETAKGIVAKYPLIFSILFCIGGLIGLILGGNFFVDGAVRIARMLHVSEAVIGLTLIALGTSLPELATSVVAAIKGESDIAMGNVIGSNIFNILAIMGITPLIAPVASKGITLVDMAVMLAFTFSLIPIMLIGKQTGRIKGAFLFLGYAAYIAWLAIQQGI
ncbi:MAG: calcium/sodium antiporter [Lentisphaeria bacterium]|nr:calcium/sodium antiporter [Lentisphaeria bacterium]